MCPDQCWVDGKITSLDLLEILSLMQPRIPFSFIATRADCCFKVQQDPHIFFCEPLSNGADPSMYCFFGLFFTRCRTLHFPFWTFWDFWQPISQACQGPSRMHHVSLAYQSLLPVLCHMQTCSGCILSHHPDY